MKNKFDRHIHQSTEVCNIVVLCYKNKLPKSIVSNLSSLKRQLLKQNTRGYHISLHNCSCLREPCAIPYSLTKRLNVYLHGLYFLLGICVAFSHKVPLSTRVNICLDGTCETERDCRLI